MRGSSDGMVRRNRPLRYEECLDNRNWWLMEYGGEEVGIVHVKDGSGCILAFGYISPASRRLDGPPDYSRIA